jgi:hypothetical protein
MLGTPLLIKKKTVHGNIFALLLFKTNEGINGVSSL